MNLAEGIKSIVSAKGIPEELILDTVKEVLTQAYVKFKSVNEINVNSDLDNNILEVFVVKTASEKVTDKINQISYQEASESLEVELEEINEETKVEVLTEPFKDFKEKEIVWISENILYKINNIEKDVIKYEFVKKRNTIVSGTIVKIDNSGNIFVDLGKTLALLPADEQSPVEHYEMDDMIKAVVTDVGSKRRGRGEYGLGSVQVYLSRKSPELVRELLNVEIPELADGVIEIKRIVREAGYKTKVAVDSDTIEPVAPCIGPHGIRITSVVKELGGEKVDLVRYTDDYVTFVKNALTPAKVERVIVNDERNVFAVVDMDQLAYAYGRRKMNVILAAKLTGSKINIKTETEVEDEQLEASNMQELHDIFVDGTPLSDLPGFSEDIINKLSENGVSTIEQLVEVDSEDIYTQLEGFSEEDVSEIKKMLSENVEVEMEDEEGAEVFEGTDLSVLPDFKDEWIEVLKENNVSCIEDLIEIVQEDTYDSLEALSDDDKAEIKKILFENVEIEE